MLDAGKLLTGFVSVSASQARGLTALSLHSQIREMIIAQLAPPLVATGEECVFSIERNETDTAHYSTGVDPSQWFNP